MSINSNPVSFGKISKSLISTILIAPVHFLILQLPEASTEFVEGLLIPDGKHPSPWAIAAVLPYFVIASGLSSVLTFASVRQIASGRKPSIAASIFEVKKKILLVVAGALLIGAVTTLGIVALVVPGIYLMALYLFVPCLIMDEDGVPLMAQLYRSTQFAKRNFRLALFVVFLIFVMSLLVYFAGEVAADCINPWTTSDGLKFVLNSIVRIILSVTLGMVIDVFISRYYLALKEVGSAS